MDILVKIFSILTNSVVDVNNVYTADGDNSIFKNVFFNTYNSEWQHVSYIYLGHHSHSLYLLTSLHHMCFNYQGII